MNLIEQQVVQVLWLKLQQRFQWLVELNLVVQQQLLEKWFQAIPALIQPLFRLIVVELFHVLMQQM